MRQSITEAARHHRPYTGIHWHSPQVDSIRAGLTAATGELKPNSHLSQRVHAATQFTAAVAVVVVDILTVVYHPDVVVVGWRTRTTCNLKDRSYLRVNHTVRTTILHVTSAKWLQADYGFTAASLCLSATVLTLDEPLVVKWRFFRGGTPLWCPRSRGIYSPSGTKFPHKKLETPGYHVVKTQSFYLTWAWFGTGSWQTDGRTDRITAANMRSAVPAGYCDKYADKPEDANRIWTLFRLILNLLNARCCKSSSDASCAIQHNSVQLSSGTLFTRHAVKLWKIMMAALMDNNCVQKPQS